MTSPLVPYALAYAARDMPVLPLERLSNVPHRRVLGSGWRFCTCTGTSALPLQGSTEPAVIRDWWAQDPIANVGVITGERSRLLVLDLDVHEGNGLTSFALWRYEREREGKALPPHPVIHTPSGGRHRWFALPPGVHLKTNYEWLPSVEVKGCGGQVAVPPSGREVETLEDDMIVRVIEQYQFMTDVPLPLAPDWLVEDVRTRHDARRRRTRGDGPGGVGWGGRANGLPPLEWFMEHGFGAEGGHREPDCYQLACLLWRLYWPNERVVLEVTRAVWERTPERPGGKPFPWEAAKNRVENARRFMRAQFEGEEVRS